VAHLALLARQYSPLAPLMYCFYCWNHLT